MMNHDTVKLPWGTSGGVHGGGHLHSWRSCVPLRSLYKQTYATADSSLSRTKQSKEQIRVLFGASATENDKLQLLILGNTQKPCWFRGTTLPKQRFYRSNKHAWMTAATLEDYILLLNRKFHEKQWKVLFMVDDWPNHGKTENLKVTTVESLPSNTTSMS